jgi:hypothetical protein
MTDTQSAGLTPVQWIAARADLGDDLAPLVAAAAEPGALVSELLANAKGAEAVRCIASALPPREGIWWAWASARHVAQLMHGAALPPLMRLALDAVDKWINAPSDETRRAAWSAGDAFGTGTPAGAAAAAVFMSGGSIGPAGSMEIPPPPGVCGSLVSTAVVLAAVSGPPKEIATAYQTFVAQGLAIIAQLGGWDAAIAATWQVLDAQQRAHAQLAASPAAAAPAASGASA